MYMKTNPKLSNVVLIYLNNTFKSTLRNKYDAINRILAVNADSFSALDDHGFFPFYLDTSRIIIIIPIVLSKGVRERLRAINLKHKWMIVELLVKIKNKKQN